MMFKLIGNLKALNAVILTGLLVSISGCGAPPAGGPGGIGGPGFSGPPGLSGSGQAPGGINPAGNIINNVKNAISGGKTGKIAKIDELLVANANPFLIKLPIPKEDIVIDPDTGSTEPAVDPFAGLDLVGVVYNDNSPVALLSIEGFDQTQMVKKGQSVDGQVNVTNIGKDYVELKRPDSGEVMTLYLPDIIGYTPSGSNSGQGNEGFNAGGGGPRDSGPEGADNASGGIAGKAMEKVGDIIKGLQDI